MKFKTWMTPFILIGIVCVLIPAYTITFLFYTFYTITSTTSFLLLAPIIIILLYFLFVLILVMEVKIITILFTHPLKEGVYKCNKLSPPVLQWLIQDCINQSLKGVLEKLLLNEAVVAGILYWILNGELGENVVIGSAVFDPYLVSIGDNVIIGKNTLVLGHQMVQDEIYLKKTRIGDNVTIGGECFISPGVTIEDNVIVGANSFVKADAVLEKNCLYAGNPAEFKKKLVKD